MPFDLDKLIAEQPKTNRKKRFSFTFDGGEFVLPNDLDVIALRAAAQGDIVTAFRRVLTDEQFQRIQASSVSLTLPVLMGLMDAYYEHVTGLNAGEPRASSNSLKSTARPSKPTSKRATKSVSLS